MKQKNFLLLFALLFMCNTLFAQIGSGIPVELKPLNPGKPPIGNIIHPDSLDEIKPLTLMKDLLFLCYQESSYLTLQCSEDERVEVVVYEMFSGVKYTSIINMVAGEVYTINTPWDAGLYTIRLTLLDGTILEGDFQIK